MFEEQIVRARHFKALHRKGAAFLMANAWSPGSAKLLASLGFEALATTSAGLCYEMGLVDGQKALGRDDVLENAAAIADAVDLPVSADLEAGYGGDAETVAETFRLARVAGLAGGSIEDATYDPTEPLYELGEAVARLQAAREGAGADFVLTARAECYLVGQPNPLRESLRRLQAYQEAGADCLYAPGLRKREEIAELVANLDLPLNVVVGLSGGGFTRGELAELGVGRVSFGSSLARALHGHLLDVAGRIRESGSFADLETAPSFDLLEDIFSR
jgi:2-methylisocitrate lyase-like PEP mutase family enzyme